MHAYVSFVLFVTCLSLKTHAQLAELNLIVNGYFTAIHNGHSVAINDSLQHNLHTLLNGYIKQLAKSHHTHVSQQLNTILKLTGTPNLVANQDQEDDGMIYVWNSNIELAYLQLFNQLNHCPDLELYKWPCILHWIHTKRSVLQTTELITDDYSIYLMDAILSGLTYDSAKNGMKIELLWDKFFFPSIISMINDTRCDVMYPCYQAIVNRIDECKPHILLNSYLNIFIPHTTRTFVTNPRLSTSADSLIVREREKQFLLAFDQFVHMFRNLFVGSTKHYYSMMQCKYIRFDMKKKYFDKWFYLDSPCVLAQDGDPPKYAVFNTFVFDSFMGQNRTNVGQHRLSQMIVYFKDAVQKSTGYGAHLKEYYYNAYTVQQAFALVHNTKYYKDICDICVAFNVDHVFRTPGLQNIYHKWMARYKRENIIDIDT